VSMLCQSQANDQGYSGQKNPGGKFAANGDRWGRFFHFGS
jgi:hypothetical protein